MPGIQTNPSFWSNFLQRRPQPSGNVQPGMGMMGRRPSPQQGINTAPTNMQAPPMMAPPPVEAPPTGGIMQRFNQMPQSRQFGRR